MVITQPGGPEVLRWQDVPDPVLPPFHVRVAVVRTAVNRADLLQRAGLYPAPAGVPADIPGLEYVGRVVERGAGCTRFAVGDRVFGLVGGGSCAEQVVVHEREAVAVPPNLSDDHAAACPEAFVTALDALCVLGGLQPGERVLVHACGSGVGTAGVQVAAALGCTVVGTSRTADKLEKCRPLGLTHGVQVTDGTFAERVRAAVGGAGVDVVLDLVGGAYVTENVGACALGGRMVLVGLTGGSHAELPLGLVLTRRLTLKGTVLRSRPLEEKIAAARLLERTLCPWLAAGRVKPVVDRVFPLQDAGAAHAYVASNASFGKVILAAAP